MFFLVGRHLENGHLAMLQLHVRAQATCCPAIISVISAPVAVELKLTSCSGDKSSRRACPSSQSEANFKSSCERYSCCWDATTNGVPWCFYSTGGTATTTSSTTTSTTSTQSSTTNAAGPAAVSQEISEILDKANETEPDALLGILERELTTEELSLNAKSIVGQVLNASFSVYEARRNQSSRPTVGSWMDFFTALIRYSSLKTNENAKLFLKSASKLLLNEFNTPFMNESVMPYMILSSMENYVMSLTTSLLGDSYLEEANQVQVLNFPNVNISTCYQDLSRGDCDVISDDVTAFSTSTRNPSFVTSITYSSDLELFSDISFHDTPATLGSFLFSLTSHFDDVVNAESNVSIVFRKLAGVDTGDASLCAFVNSTTGDWSSSGCFLASENSSHVTCFCNHNTSFALLFLHTDLQFTAAEENYFNVITYIGCGTSITALMMTICSFIYLKLTRNKRVILHINLATSLGLGQIILLTGTRVETGTAACKVIAILLHFFFMSSFSWMLMEGTLLYFQSVRAVKGSVNFNAMLGFGWALPVVIVGVSLAAGFDGYGTDRGCWLSLYNGLTWAFIGPALGFIIVNMILLAMIVRIFLKLKANAKEGEWQRTRRAIKAIALLTPLLGITWIFGALAVNQSTKWFLYLFSIFNSFQGLVIFVFHCLRNDQVRKAFLKKYRRSFANMAPFFSTVNPSSEITNVKTTSAITSTPNFLRKLPITN